MSEGRKQTRSVSEETQLRKLLLTLTDHVLELKATSATNMKLIKGRFDDVEAELAKLRQSSGKNERAVKAVAILAGDALAKTNDLHNKLIGSADKLGARLHALERQKTGDATRRSPR